MPKENSRDDDRGELYVMSNHEERLTPTLQTYQKIYGTRTAADTIQCVMEDLFMALSVCEMDVQDVIDRAMKRVEHKLENPPDA